MGGVGKLKEQPSGDIAQYGFGPVFHALMAAGLIDVLRSWVHPFLTGTRGLMHRPGSSGRFEFAHSTTLDSGIMILNNRAVPPGGLTDPAADL